MSRSATTAKACGWDVCVVAGWAYSKCTQGRLTLCGIWLKKWCLAICRQKQGRTKMSCCTCVAGNGVMSAIMATCCRRQLPNWWIAEPTMGVKKLAESTSDAHGIYKDLSKFNRFWSRFFSPKLSYQKSSEQHFILKITGDSDGPIQQTLKTLARFRILRDVFELHHIAKQDASLFLWVQSWETGNPP